MRPFQIIQNTPNCITGYVDIVLVDGIKESTQILLDFKFN